MKIVMTVCNRPHYLRETLDSWGKVRGLDQAEFIFCCEPTPQLSENIEILDFWAGQHRTARAKAVINDSILGVSRNPYTGLSREFDAGASYVIAAEDDIVVSDDILEYHRWAERQFCRDLEIAAICSYTTGTGDPYGVERRPLFSPLIWGTWKDRWDKYVGAEWDVDVVHYTDRPGHEVGWDWHLVKRIMPPRKKQNIFPHMSRSNHIGVVGTHSYVGNYMSAQSYREHYEQDNYFEGGESDFSIALMH